MLTPTPPGRRTRNPSYEDFELDEDEATALNCFEELDPEEAESGHVIQLQMAAKGMKALKAKSKRRRRGGIGHWAGDPECKFPTSKGGKSQGHRCPETGPRWWPVCALGQRRRTTRQRGQ